MSYLRAINVQRNKEVFDVSRVDAALLAEAMGLAVVPKIKVVKDAKRKAKNEPYALQQLKARAPFCHGALTPPLLDMAACAVFFVQTAGGW